MISPGQIIRSSRDVKVLMNLISYPGQRLSGRVNFIGQSCSFIIKNEVHKICPYVTCLQACIHNMLKFHLKYKKRSFFSIEKYWYTGNLISNTRKPNHKLCNLAPG